LDNLATFESLSNDFGIERQLNNSMKKKEQEKAAKLFWKGFKIGVIPGSFVTAVILGASPLVLILCGLPFLTFLTSKIK
jgi:site-specific recombinase